MGKLGVSLGVWQKSLRSAMFHFRPTVLAITGALLFANLCSAQTASTSLPSETPSTFTPVTTSFNYVKRDVMIPMRDGVKLHTVIMCPQRCQRCADPAHANSL